MTRYTFVFACMLVLPVIAGCPGPKEPPDNGGAGGAPVEYTGPSPSPICGSIAYDTACREWKGDAVPYCYAPAKRGDIGPAPFTSCVTVTGGDAPPLDTGDHGWASWWCCPFHNEGDGGSVVLDSGTAGMGGSGGGIGI